MPKYTPLNDPYTAAHRRVMRARGKAREHPCVECGKPADEWSLNKETVGTIAVFKKNRRGKVEDFSYSDNDNDYSPRCRPCHSRYDHRRGEDSPIAKLTNTQVITIFTSSEPGKVLAERYGVTRWTITAIRSRKNYPSVTKDLVRGTPAKWAKRTPGKLTRPES